MCKFRRLISVFFFTLIVTFPASIIANDAEIDAAKDTHPDFKIAAKQVLNVMNRWARAWAQLDARTYISSYAPDYVGKGFPSHFTWAASRQQRLGKQKHINLSLTDVELYSTQKGVFSINFTQHYESDSYKDITRKQLDFKYINDTWYIVAEKTLPRK